MISECLALEQFFKRKEDWPGKGHCWRYAVISEHPGDIGTITGLSGKQKPDTWREDNMQGLFHGIPLCRLKKSMFFLWAYWPNSRVHGMVRRALDLPLGQTSMGKMDLLRKHLYPKAFDIRKILPSQRCVLHVCLFANPLNLRWSCDLL